jgi:hypothetical protein
MNLNDLIPGLTPEQTEHLAHATFDEIRAARAHTQQLAAHNEQHLALAEQIRDLTRPYFAQLPAGATITDVTAAMTEPEQVALEVLIEQANTKPTITPPLSISAVEPDEGIDCGLCDNTTDVEDYAVTMFTLDGRWVVCDDCAMRHAEGLLDIAQGLNQVSYAIKSRITQEQRPTVRRLLAELTDLVKALETGDVVMVVNRPDGTQLVDRPGGDDPHATTRRHTLKPV